MSGSKLILQEHFTPEEAKNFISEACGRDQLNELLFLVDAAQTTDGVARTTLISSVLNGVGGDQKTMVEKCKKPMALVFGTEDTLVNDSYVKQNFPSIVHFMAGSHLCFWDHSKQFNEFLEGFIKENRP